MSTLKIAFRNLGRRKSRNILTIIGITVGIAALIALISLTLGLSAHINSQFQNLGVDVLVYPTSGKIPNSAVATIQGDAGVYAVAPRISFGMVAMPQNISVPFNTIDPDAEAKIGYLKPLLGSLSMGENQTVLGYSIAQKLGAGINNNITFQIPSFPPFPPKEFNLTVVGILNRSQEFISFSDSFGFVNVAYAENMTDVNAGLSAILVKCWTSDLSPYVAYVIQQQLPDVSVVSQSEIRSVVNGVTGTVNFFLYVATGLALIVSCLGAANTMAVAVIERRREIGVMKAVGAKGRNIMGVFIIESMLLGFLGGILGLAIGYAAGYAVQWYVSSALWYISFIAGYKPIYDWWIFPLGLGIAVIISLIAGAYPAWRASRLKPVETLRYE